uniref:CD99 antigen-like protein 2 n=1 Tax=Eptatretus burgeri TaxID=7764 RepID=A0A8C4N1C8_EPTBU
MISERFIYCLTLVVIIIAILSGSVESAPTTTNSTDNSTEAFSTASVNVSNDEGTGNETSKTNTPGGESPLTAEDPTDKSTSDSSTLGGIIGGVLAAVVTGISGYIAYQKKKLCFKDTGGQRSENNAAEMKKDAENKDPSGTALMEGKAGEDGGK